jgi:hypothetical protein
MMFHVPYNAWISWPAVRLSASIDQIRSVESYICGLLKAAVCRLDYAVSDGKENGKKNEKMPP